MGKQLGSFFGIPVSNEELFWNAMGDANYDKPIAQVTAVESFVDTTAASINASLDKAGQGRTEMSKAKHLDVLRVLGAALVTGKGGRMLFGNKKEINYFVRGQLHKAMSILVGQHIRPMIPGSLGDHPGVPVHAPAKASSGTELDAALTEVFGS